MLSSLSVFFPEFVQSAIGEVRTACFYTFLKEWWAIGVT